MVRFLAETGWFLDFWDQNSCCRKVVSFKMQPPGVATLPSLGAAPNALALAKEHERDAKKRDLIRKQAVPAVDWSYLSRAQAQGLDYNNL